MKKMLILLICMGILGFTGIAEATILDLAPPASTYNGQVYVGDWYVDYGSSRGVLFDAVSSFTLNSVGIELNLGIAMTLTAELYSVTGVETVGNLLASNSLDFTDKGRSWYDIPLSKTITGGNRYLLNINCDALYYEAVFYDFEAQNYFNMGYDPPFTVGPVSVFDGTMGFDGLQAGPNYVLAHFRMDVNAAPLPGTWLLLGSGLVGLTGLRRKFKN